MNQKLVSQTIKKFQDKLLDLSARNKLLNFKFLEKARTQIRIVNDAPDRIYQRLNEGRKLGLQTLPEPDSTPPEENSEQFQRTLIEMRSTDEQYQSAIANDDESPENSQAIERLLRDKVRTRLKLPKLIGSKISPTPQQQAQGLGINPAYDLPSSVTDGKSNNLILQTLLFPKEFERKASGLISDARTSIQQTGRNTLYLAFGMLEWFESESSDVRFISPLLLYPVSIERESVRGQYRYFIKAYEDEVEVNPCLRERLRRDFGIELPDFQGDANTTNSPDAYFREVAQLIEGLNRWQVRQFVTLSILSFGNFALYKDIDPEKWANDGLASHPIVSSLLGGGNSETHDTFKIPSDYDVDKPDISRRVPLIISETDASQFSAIVDVMDGKNLVIEGPPGTGKSQTITNLIAAALAKGKTVLFVAEKMAAVEVVRDRLDAVGLRDFCLEIHSTNKPKVDVYKEIKARCERGDLTQSANPHDIEREYLKNRQQLTDYVELVNQPFGAMGDENTIHTIQEILWRSKGLQQEFKSTNIPENLLSLSIANPHSLTRFDFDKHRTLLRKFIRVKTELEQTNQDIDIWNGINALDIDPIEQEQLVRSFAELSRVISDTLKLYQNQVIIFELSYDPTLGNLKYLDDLLLKIPEIPIQIEPALLTSLRSPTSILLCREFAQKYCEARESLNRVNQFFENGNAELSNLEQVQEFVSKLHSIKQDRQLSQEWITQPIRSQVDQLWRNDRNISEQWQRGIPTFEHLQNLLNLDQNLHLADISNIAAVLSFVESTPEYILSHRNSKLCDPANRNLLSKAESLQRKQVFLQKKVHLERCKDSQKLRQYAKKIVSSGILFFIDCKYWKANELWKNIKNFMNVSSDREISEVLTQVADFWDEYADLKGDGINQICGELYREFETDYKLCREVNDYGCSLEVLISQISCKDKIKEFLINSSIETLKDAVAYNNHPDFQELQKTCQNLIDKRLPSISDSSSISTILEDRKQEIDQTYQNLLQLKIRSDLSLQELPLLMSEMHNYQRSQEELDSPLFTSIFGTYPKSELFSLESLLGCIDWAEAIHRAKFPENIKNQCLSSNVREFIAGIKEFETQYHSLIRQQDRYCETAMSLGKIDSLAMFGNVKILDCNAAKVRDRLQQLNQLDSLHRYLSYSQVKAEIKSSNLWDFIDIPSSSNLIEEQIDCLYKTIFYRSLVSEIHKKHINLRLFKGEDQLIARQEFQKLDREILNLYQSKLAAQLSQNQIPEGNGKGQKNTWTEKALIKNEIIKQARLAPLRSLFQRSGNALQSLHPCWMMSPASVAQFIPSNSIRFDLIIIDEASQMRPEEALGVIARGKQLVVVGDPMQLPPTDFFKSIGNVDGDDEESILDMTMKTFSVRRLKWHYRSRHESLIAFSNKHFYDNTLTVFPSPSRKFAINFHHIAEGLYQSGVNVNPIEAKRVVEATLEFMRSYPNLSLGVVALNKTQRDLIEEEMDLIANTHPEVASYIAKWEKTLSSFFIKNLENVQGDERDVIFISTVYGRERPDLPVAQRFGPINTANGHRRLNVLFTRAKERIEVFSSMTAADIRPTESSNRGVHALRDYLEYIQTQQLKMARLTGREPDSDFEVFVAKAIRAKGFEVVAQVGVANYFIDLAIVDPNRAGTYLLGIECDGATYHSSKAARDRDRYRQEALEKLGWKLYRIWSTDWFKNSEEEIEKLVKYINGILKPAITLP
jgi:very-short-patch-repair endonuclease/DNA polymerase III delta prime subunit